MSGKKYKQRQKAKQVSKDQAVNWDVVWKVLASIFAFAGSLATVYDLVGKIRSDAPTFYSFILPGLLILIWLVILIQLIRKKNLYVIPLLAITVVGGVVGGVGWQSYYRSQENKVTVLVTQFDGPEETYGVRRQMLEDIRTATRNYKDTQIIEGETLVTSTEHARELGKKENADLVIWAWYRPTENPNITLHLESLSPPVGRIIEESITYQPQASLSDLNSFEIQKKLGAETSILIQLLSGYFMYLHGDYQEAATRFEKISQESVSTFIDESNFYLLLGLLHMNLGQYDHAILDYSKIIEKDPSCIEAYNNRALAHSHLAHSDQALLDFEKAIELDSEYAPVYNNRGTTYYNIGQYERAIRDFNKAIELEPNYTVAYNNRGMAYDEMEQYKQAIQDYNTAVDIDPNYFRAYYNRGISFAHLNEYDAAIEDFNKAIKIFPKYRDAYNNRGLSYFSLGKYDQAIQDFNKAISIDMSYTATYNNRGLSYFRLGQYNRAIQDFTTAIKLDANNAGAYKNRGVVYNALGRSSEADADFKKYEELTGEKP